MRMPLVGAVAVLCAAVLTPAPAQAALAGGYVLHAAWYKDGATVYLDASAQLRYDPRSGTMTVNGECVAWTVQAVEATHLACYLLDEDSSPYFFAAHNVASGPYATVVREITVPVGHTYRFCGKANHGPATVSNPWVEPRQCAQVAVAF